MATTAAGLALAGMTAVGNAMTDVGRKMLSRTRIGNAEQIAIVCLLEGAIGLLYLLCTGALELPPWVFWLPATASALLNALAKTLQTKAYSEYDISLCAPFNAALPVMQFLVSTYVLREPELPLRRVAGVFVVAAGAMTLARRSAPGRTNAGGAAGAKSPKAGQRGGSRGLAGDPGFRVAGLSMGPLIVLFNCTVWSFTTKLDELATRAAGKTVYLCIGKTMTGIAAGIGALGAGRARSVSGRAKLQPAAAKAAATAAAAAAAAPRPLWRRPDVLGLLLAVACLEGFYMLCYYAAITRTSKVYVVAIKKGGGLLISALFGALFFKESTEGRKLPVAAIVAGVVLLAL
eukprot:g1594.t1